ncbi:MAG: hypothetical protein H0X63_12985 [Flavobacteriales bacterium]|nr:hypothetical protein [Flavobacteriales bacterium]
MKIKIVTFSLLLASSSLFAQWQLTGNTLLGTEYLGTNNNQPLRLYTNLTERMTITSTGLVGIGTTNPIHKLDINDGNINLVTSTRGYMINKRFVLWHNGNASNIYLGDNAGNATSTGSFNTFLGNKAGVINTTGYQNTFTI